MRRHAALAAVVTTFTFAHAARAQPVPWRPAASLELSAGEGAPALGTRDLLSVANVDLRVQGPVAGGVRGTALLAREQGRAALATAWGAIPLGRGVGLSGVGSFLGATNAPRTWRADVGVDASWRPWARGDVTLRLFGARTRHAGVDGDDAGLDVVTGVSATRALRLALVARGTVATRDMRALEAIGVPVPVPAEIGLPVAMRLRRHALDLSPTVRWSHARGSAELSLTVRAGDAAPTDRRPGWAAGGEVALGGPWRLVLGAGRQLPDLRLMIGAVRWASLGVRVAWDAGARRAVRTGDAATRIDVEAGRVVVRVAVTAAAVALRGDFTGFAARACTRRAPGRFDCGEAPPPGAHRVAIAVDGAPWRAPGNLPAVGDDFGADEGDWLVPAR